MNTVTDSLVFKETTVPTLLGRVFVREVGTGPAMLFWPSLMMDGDMWLEQARHFASRYRVILVDPPGFGRSQPLQRVFHLEECALCVRQLLAALAVPEVILVGNSWGGMLGGTFAALYPEQTRAAVLMNSTGSAAGWRQRLEYLALSQAARLLGGINGYLENSALRAFVGPTTEARYPEVVAAIRAQLARVNVASAHWAVNSVVTFRRNQLPLLATISVPVLVVAGEEDRTFPVAETRLMHQAIPGSQFQVMANTAHLAALERPHEVNALIDAFLEEITADKHRKGA